MKIATWNVERVQPGGSSRSTRIRDSIAKVDADVWVLTESHQEFSPGASFALIARSKDATDRTGGECWVAIWARKTWGAEELVVNGQPHRSAAVLVPRPGLAGLIVFGTVLPWRGDGGGRAFEIALEQ